MKKLGLAERVNDLLEKYEVPSQEEVVNKAKVLRLHDKPVVNFSHFDGVDLMYNTHNVGYKDALVNMIAFCGCVEYGNTGRYSDRLLVLDAKSDLKDMIGVDEGELVYNFFNVRDAIENNAKKRGVSTKDYIRDMFYSIH